PRGGKTLTRRASEGAAPSGRERYPSPDARVIGNSPSLARRVSVGPSADAPLGLRNPRQFSFTRCGRVGYLLMQPHSLSRHSMNHPLVIPSLIVCTIVGIPAPGR